MTNPDEQLPGLFALDPGWRAAPAPADPTSGLSAGRRLTLRQAADLERGRHPLTRGPLHPDAAPADDRTAAGARCATCRFRRPVHGGARAYPKCLHGWSGDPRDEPPRCSNGPATDVRGWWPACRDYQPHDPTDKSGDLK